MSAIFGCIAFDGSPLDTERLGAARQALVPYGPDGSGTATGPDASFTEFRMSLTRHPVPEGPPPSEGPLTVIADAVLDDRAGLARDLGLETANGLSDSALILRAWTRWGVDCPRHLIGDFAFAVWDRERRQLHLVRDHVGTRPLYWTRSNGRVLFATDIRALIAVDLDRKIDGAMVARFLTAADRPLPKTLFEGIFFVPPGEVLTVTAEAETTSRWWEPGRIARRKDLDIAAAAAELRALLETAVACRIDTDAPVGSHISGGLDSTALTIMAARALKRRGKTLTAYCWAPDLSEAFPEMARRDERVLIGALGTAEGFRLRYGTADGAVLAGFLRREMEFEGTADLLDEIPVLDKAAADGVRVLLSGWGGDEAVSSHGTGYLAFLLARGRFVAAFRVLRAITGGRRNPRVLARTLWYWGLLPMLPDRLFELWSPYARYYRNRSFMSRVLAGRQGGATPERDIRPVSDPRRYMALLLTRGHLAARMDSWAAWGARKGLQYRYPLLDRRVLEFVLSLPSQVFHGPGEGRDLFRRALADLLPQWAGKHDPANERLRNQARRECWAILAQSLRHDARPSRHGWIDREALLRRVETVPGTLSLDDIVAFAEIVSATRIWHLDRRRE